MIHPARQQPLIARATFKPENGYVAFFDFIHYYPDVPDGIRFDVRASRNGWTLVACGYGCLEQHSAKCYGSGALHVYPNIRTKSRTQEDE